MTIQTSAHGNVALTHKSLKTSTVKSLRMPKGNVSNLQQGQRSRHNRKLRQDQNPSWQGACEHCGRNHSSHLCYKVIGGCFKRGLTDHMVRDCLNNRNQGNRPPQQPYKFIGGSFKYGLTDHMVRDCPNKRNQGNKPSQQPPKQAPK